MKANIYICIYIHLRSLGTCSSMRLSLSLGIFVNFSVLFPPNLKDIEKDCHDLHMSAQYHSKMSACVCQINCMQTYVILDAFLFVFCQKFSHVGTIRQTRVSLMGDCSKSASSFRQILIKMVYVLQGAKEYCCWHISSHNCCTSIYVLRVVLSTHR